MPGSRSSGAAITSGAVIVDKVAAADAAEALEPACWVLRTAPGEDLPRWDLAARRARRPRRSVA